MIRRGAAWILATVAALLALAALLPGDLGGVEQVAALLPVSVPVAVVALLLSGRRRSALVAAAALLVTGVIVGRELAARRADTGGHVMVVVTHNVARANRDPVGTAAALAASGADVLLLQETDGTFAPYLERLRQAYPYGNPCRRPCSLAILSRWPLARVRWRFHDANGKAFGPGLMATTVRLPWGGDAPLASVHLTRESAAANRAIRRDNLAEAVHRAGPNSLVLGGDFNLSPWGDSMRRLDEAMQPTRRLTRATFSFPAYPALPFPLIPIDHVFAGPGWTVADVRRLPRTGSDHYPIRVNLLWRARGS